MRNLPGGAVKSWVAAVVGVISLLATPVGAQEPRQQRILALYATTPGAAGAIAFETTYQKLFSEALGMRLDFQSEYIDLARFSDPGYSAALVEFLRYKYDHLRPDVVIATTELSRGFAEQYRSLLFPGVPIVFIDRVNASHREPDTTGLNAVLNLAGTVDLALALQPDLEHLFVISGVSTFDRFYDRLAREQLKAFKGRVAITHWSDRTFVELERDVARLPPHSAIFFLTLGEDSSGARFVSLNARDRLSAVANAPMYAWNQVALDHGVIGGRLFSNEIVAASSAEMALRILRGEDASEMPLLTVDPTVVVVDWRELRRWTIPESRVPAGATIVFREPTLWDRYKVYISGALLLFFLQTALIAGLLVQSGRRRRAEAEMREHQQMLEGSNRQISELFGRLIAAQEAERTRIARELHDDVSQRVAALSIAMSSLKRKLLGNADEGEVVGVVSAMQRDTAMLAEEIRGVSHDLHPSVLQHAGLVTALAVFCKQFGKVHELNIRFTAAANLRTIDDAAALCLYRITQEALHNVAKHASATEVGVSLTRDGEVLQLAIADNGKGFQLAGTRSQGPGLGLISIDERARLLGGDVAIETRPGGGTRVQVRLQRPLMPALAAAGTGF